MASATAPVANKNVKIDPSKAPSAKPGTTEPKAKKEKVARIDYVIPAEAAWVKDGKLLRRPDDFDSKKNKPLGRRQFVSDVEWFTYQAERADRLAARFRKQADEAGRIGNTKDKAKAKQLVKMRDKFAALQAELAAQGIDVAALLAAKEAEVTASAEAAS